jgi:hypothetical protein
MTKKRKQNHKKRKQNRPRPAEPARVVNEETFEFVRLSCGTPSDTWFPTEIDLWAAAHLVRCAERHELPQLADSLGVPLAELPEWSREVIDQIGGEVSVSPTKPEFPQWAWSHIPHTRPAPSPNVLSVGPRAWFTIYRSGVHDLAFTDEEVERALAIPPLRRRLPQERMSVTVPDDPWITERCYEPLMAANSAWWRYDNQTPAQSRVQRYTAGDTLEQHQDRSCGATPLRTGAAATPSRVLGAIVMLQHAEVGGLLQLDVKGFAQWHTIDIDVGDIVVFDPMTVHRVTEVERGERVIIQAGLQDWR